jgi:heat-inducible transcriptional repressor
MRRPFALSGRNLGILSAIIRSYITTGEPVGSGTVARRRRDGLSPASIRNVMAELESQGYLSHPHTSAGRVPTEKALMYYVHSLARTPHLEPSEADFVQDSLGQAHTLEERLDRTSHVLAALTGQLALVVLAPLSEAVLEHVQFLRLADHRILVVLVARGDVVRHRIIRIQEEIRPETLERIANYVNHDFAGWKLSTARAEILRRLEEERALFDDILKQLRVLCLHGFLTTDSGAQVYLEGTPNLLQGAQGLEPEHLRQLLQALEEKEKLIELLDQCLRSDMRLTSVAGREDEALYVRIGLEDAEPAMRDYAAIGAVCQIEPGLAGRMAVIGPTRMHYERVLSAVAHVASVFEHLAEAD